MMRALQPFAALVKRELIRSLRRVRPFFLVAGVVAVATLIVYANFPDYQVTPVQLSNHSMSILSSFLALLAFAAVLLLPGYASTAIVVEREQDTYDLLSLTLTTPTAIVLAKLVNSLGFYLLIGIAVLPLVGAAFFLVGIDIALLGFAAIYLATIALPCASAGIMSSAISRSTPRATLLSYLVAFMSLVGYMIPPGLVFAMFGISGSMFMTRQLEPIIFFFASLSPLTAVPRALAMSATAATFSAPRVLTGIICGQGLFSLLMLLVARRTLKKANVERDFSSVALTSLQPLTPVSLAVPPPLPGTPVSPPNTDYSQQLPPWPPVRDNVNPLYAREVLQVHQTQQLTPLRLAIGAIGILSVMLVIGYAVSEATNQYSRSTDAPGAVTAWMIGLGALLALITPALSATPWSREYERETMDLLRGALLTPSQLVLAKARAAAIACILPLALTCLASLPFFPFPFMSAHAMQQFAMGLVTVAVIALLCISIDTLAGLLTRRSATGILYGYAFNLAALFWPMVIWALENLLELITRGRYNEHHEAYLFCSPIFAYAVGLNVNSSTAENLLLWVIGMLFNVFVSAAALWLAIQVFRRWHLTDT